MRTWFRLSPKALLWPAAFVCLAISSGCGLVVNDSTDVNLSSLEKQFSIDATAWNVNSAAVTALINQSCTPEADSCASVMTKLSTCKAATCTARCSADTNTCQLSLRVELWRAINLVSEVPDLVSANAQTMSTSLEVTLDDMTYEVFSNALTIDTPKLGIYAAPSTVMISGGDGAVRIAEIPTVPAATELGSRSITFMPGGKELLRRRLSDYQVPFNLLVASEILVDQTTPIPMGQLDATLQMRGHAGF
jgi:hypothetical protein